MSICISLYPVFCVYAVAAHRISSLLSSHYNGIVLTATATDGLDLVLLLDLYYLIDCCTYVREQEIMRHIYSAIYVECVVKDPLYEPGVSFENANFTTALNNVRLISSRLSLPSSECREHVTSRHTHTHTHMYVCELVSEYTCIHAQSY